MSEQDKHWNAFCDELEEMIDAADDAWEAEQRGSINKRDSIKEGRYDVSKGRMRAHLDLYIDARIKEFVRDHTTARIVIYRDEVVDQVTL